MVNWENYECDGQMTFEDYLLEKNKQYAKNCRHQRLEHCYMQQQPTDIAKLQCPCEYYEIREKCEGCQHDDPKQYHRECFGCKRYNYNAGVNTKDIPDKYEEVKKDG